MSDRPKPSIPHNCPRCAELKEMLSDMQRHWMLAGNRHSSDFVEQKRQIDELQKSVLHLVKRNIELTDRIVELEMTP